MLEVCRQMFLRPADGGAMHLKNTAARRVTGFSVMKQPGCQKLRHPVVTNQAELLFRRYCVCRCGRLAEFRKDAVVVLLF